MDTSYCKVARCNWAFSAIHHKVWAVYTGDRGIIRNSTIQYKGVTAPCHFNSYCVVTTIVAVVEIVRAAFVNL